MPDLAEMPDLDQAIARLEAAEAAETPPPAEAFVQTEVESETPQQPTAQPEPGKAAPPDSKSTDTPAAAEPKPSAEPKKIETQKPADAKGSNFTRDKQRRDDSWKALNAEKSAFQKDQEKLKADRELFQREQEALKLERAKASQKFTPEQYDGAAQQRISQAEALDLQAAGLEARAKGLDTDGKFDDAERLRAQAKDLLEQAAGHRGMSRQLKEYARHVRDNPDPTLQQHQQRRQQELRDYTLKAAEQWPDLAKEGSEFQKTVAGHLQESRKNGLDANEFPVLMYHAARLTAAETAAARVPEMDKELGELRAKVKELELLTAPGGGTGAAQRIQPGDQALTDEQEGELLRQQAAQLG